MTRRILMVGDAGCQTGFARVLKAVADHLHGTGNYEVVVRGINYQTDHGIDYDYDVQPIGFDTSDPTGAASLKDHIEQVQPDVLWAIQDPWHLAGYAFEKPKDLPSVCYVPVDNPAVKWDNALALASWTEVVTYTQFGARELAASMQDAVDIVVEGTEGLVSRDAHMTWLQVPSRSGQSFVAVTSERLARLQNPTLYNVIPHGLDHGRFPPRSRTLCRQEFGLDPDAFTVGMVCTNMERKRIDIAIRAFADLVRHGRNAQFVLHCYGKDDTGYDIASLARLYGVADKVSAIHWQYPVLTEDRLSYLYSCFDVHVNTSSGEGWGLTSFESASCGAAQIVPDWAATGELWKGAAWLARPISWRHATSFLNTAHADISIDDVYRGLREMYDNREVLAEYQAKAQARSLVAASWSDVGKAFENVIDTACAGEAPAPMSLQDVLDARAARVRSVVLGDAE